MKVKKRRAQAFGRVNIQILERIESSEEYLCIINSKRELLGYKICLLFIVFGTFRMSAIVISIIRHRTHCKTGSTVRHGMA
jgi:hypothetical protein